MFLAGYPTMSTFPLQNEIFSSNWSKKIRVQSTMEICWLQPLTAAKTHSRKSCLEQTTHTPRRHVAIEMWKNVFRAFQTHGFGTSSCWCVGVASPLPRLMVASAFLKAEKNPVAKAGHKNKGAFTSKFVAKTWGWRSRVKFVKGR